MLLGKHPSTRLSFFSKWSNAISVLCGSVVVGAALASCGGSGGGSAILPAVDPCIALVGAEAARILPRFRQQSDRFAGTLAATSPGVLEYSINADSSLNFSPPPGSFTFFALTYLFVPIDSSVRSATFTQTSSQFDTFLFGGNSNINVAQSNDDIAQGNTNSQITLPIQSNTCYLIVATSYWAQNSTSTAVGSPGRGNFDLQLTNTTSAQATPVPAGVIKPATTNGGGGDRGGRGGGLL